jgi:hypothetical protein
MQSMNSPNRKEFYQQQFDTIMMPLLTLSCSDTGINDQGLNKFIKRMEELQQRYEPAQVPGITDNLNQQYEKDYYRGGMAINFSSNMLSSLCFRPLSQLIISFRGLRSINLSNMLAFKPSTSSPSKDSKKRTGARVDKNDQM